MQSIVSVGQFPLPGLDDLRAKHCAIISEQTSYKPFFLAKRDLAALKRQYSKIRKKQIASATTTYILKAGNTVAAANSRHANRAAKPSLLRTPATKTPRKLHKRSSAESRAQAPSNNGTNKQVTMRWDKMALRRRARANKYATGGSTSSSSSTELCDSDSSSSCEVSDTPESVTLRAEPERNSNDNNNNIDEVRLAVPRNESSPGLHDGESIGSASEEERENKPLNAKMKRMEWSRSSTTLDTSNSELFLEEMSKLGKSDSFYENMSKRICELQFENLRIIQNCNTEPTKWNLTVQDMLKSPLLSPIGPPRSPILSSLDLATSKIYGESPPSSRTSSIRSPGSAEYTFFPDSLQVGSDEKVIQCQMPNTLAVPKSLNFSKESKSFHVTPVSPYEASVFWDPLKSENESEYEGE